MLYQSYPYGKLGGLAIMRLRGFEGKTILSAFPLF